MMLHRASAKTKPINSAMSSNFGTNITNKPFESATSLSSSSLRILIPALPPLNSDSSGTYSLFSSTSSAKLRNNSNILPLNKSYDGSIYPGNMAEGKEFVTSQLKEARTMVGAERQQYT